MGLIYLYLYFIKGREQLSPCCMSVSSISQGFTQLANFYEILNERRLWQANNKEFCVLHVQSNTTIIHLLVQ